MLSTRFALPVVALLALAAVPTVIHSYIPSSPSDGRTAAGLPMKLGNELGVQTKRRANWGHDRFSSSDWTERQYGGATGVTLFVGRSMDPKKLYHHPELALADDQFGKSTILRLPQRSDVPVHVLQGTGDNGTRVALYTLHYEDGYVGDPILFQLRTSFRLLFSRRQPMTLFYATQNLKPNETVESSRAAALLLAAMESFERQQ